MTNATFEGILFGKIVAFSFSALFYHNYSLRNVLFNLDCFDYSYLAENYFMYSSGKLCLCFTYHHQLALNIQ